MSARIALVLGGGGLKGFAHIGVLEALAEAGVRPSLYAGTSIGALMAAASAAGMSTEAMKDHAIKLQRRDLFRFNRVGMLLELRRVASIYAGEPLRALCEANIRPGTFDDLPVPRTGQHRRYPNGHSVRVGVARPAPCSSCRRRVRVMCTARIFPPGNVDGRMCIEWRDSRQPTGPDRSYPR